MADLTRILGRLTAPLRRRVYLMVGRAVVRLVDDAAKTQALQLAVLDGEVLDGVERIQDYGFTSRPFAGAEAVVLSVAGNRSHGLVVVCGDKRYRLTGLAEGEVALHDDQGQSVVLKRGKVAEITTDTLIVKAAVKVRLEAPLVEATGLVNAAGEMTALTAGTPVGIGAFRNIYNTHTHPENDAGGPTDAPNQTA